MDWNHMFTSFDGRISRAKFWAGYVVLWITAAISVGIISTLLGDDTSTTMAFSVMYLVAIAILFLAGLAIQVKRWHDRGKSGWWVLIALVPIIGALWAIIETGFLQGTRGANEYGPDPIGWS